ncbi:MAG: DM13 domain-containing protein [Bryobacteraceae bacterium]
MPRSKDQWALLLLTAALIALGKPAWMWAFPLKPMLQGEFHSVAHRGTGRATIYRGMKGELILEVTNARTAFRPDLMIYLLDAPDAANNEDAAKARCTVIARFDPAGANLRFRLPAGLDLSTPKSVTIWSPKYGVNFTTAPLRPVVY